jgi:hypothetical protein
LFEIRRDQTQESVFSPAINWSFLYYCALLLKNTTCLA